MPSTGELAVVADVMVSLSSTISKSSRFSNSRFVSMIISFVGNDVVCVVVLFCGVSSVFMKVSKDVVDDDDVLEDCDTEILSLLFFVVSNVSLDSGSDIHPHRLTCSGFTVAIFSGVLDSSSSWIVVLDSLDGSGLDGSGCSLSGDLDSVLSSFFFFFFFFEAFNFLYIS